MRVNIFLTLLRGPRTSYYIGQGPRVEPNTIRLLLTAFCYTRRSVSCSAIIRGTSSCSTQEINTERDPQLDNVPSPKRDVSISSLHSWLRELHSNGGRKIVTAKGDGAQQGSKTS